MAHWHPAFPHFPAFRRASGLAAVGSALALALVSGCAVGPTYHPPATAVPAAFKESEGWKTAAPSDIGARGAWWRVFNDPILDELESRVAAANYTVQQAAANYEEAREIARADRATLLPAITASGSADRSRSAGSRAGLGGSAVANAFAASVGASWEPDFWGRIRRQTQEAVASAQASAADLADARLSIESTLAQDYVGLRVADEKKRLLANATEAYRRTLAISRNRYAVGVAAQSDVLSAEAQLDSARAQLVDVDVQRAQFEHAIAVLLGQPPAEFALTPRMTLDLPVPAVPPVLPSALLERRPDIAGAERAVAAANAEVGVQTAGYFPTIDLSAAAGFQSSVLRQLFDAPNRVWSLGADVGETIFDWGQRRAELHGAEAAYDSSVAGYRQTVLTAFQQVEDDLAALHYLEQEAGIQQAVVSEAARATQIATNEYAAGTVDYTTVAAAQVAELSDRESALATRQSRLDSDVSLIAALGGGWKSSDLPTPGQVVARRSTPAVAAVR